MDLYGFEWETKDSFSRGRSWNLTICQNTGFLKETSGPGWTSLWFHIQLNSDKIGVFLANPNKLLEIYFRLEMQWKGAFLWILDNFGMFLFFLGVHLGRLYQSLVQVFVVWMEKKKSQRPTCLGDVDFLRKVRKWISLLWNAIWEKERSGSQKRVFSGSLKSQRLFDHSKKTIYKNKHSYKMGPGTIVFKWSYGVPNNGLISGAYFTPKFQVNLLSLVNLRGNHLQILRKQTHAV